MNATIKFLPNKLNAGASRKMYQVIVGGKHLATIEGVVEESTWGRLRQARYLVRLIGEKGALPPDDALGALRGRPVWSGTRYEDAKAFARERWGNEAAQAKEK